uniref:60S ribosomal protein L13 n=1 Tax=Panagrolaimus sp. ES5 TaxID=591445 RepID=A0AC34FFV3_9BILA
MTSVWQKLKQPECLRQLRDGVDSVLTDLIGIVDVYAQVEPDTNLSDSEFRTFVDLLDPRLILRTLRILKCLLISLSKPITISNDTFYELLKMLYRCCLFTSPSEGSELLEFALVILFKLVEVFSNRFGTLEALHNTIGYWIGCLMADDKKAEIDVFALCVNGPTSSNTNPIELICGNEICAITENERPKIIIERKIILARFLSPIVDALYRSGMVIREQPVYISIQLIFIPYLRSTVLSQRLGAALMLNCWARMFRRQALRNDLQTPIIFPEAAVSEAVTALSSQPEVFNDVIISVQNLATECDEFTRYCRRNGAKEDDMPDTAAAEELEGYTKAAYNACMKFCKPQNVTLVNARFEYISMLIKSTKATIRINANRVNALIGSALFYFNHTPPKLTPMIRPLMESAENEDQIKMSEETLFDSIPLMLLVTSNRDPCPHAKIVKQICIGLTVSPNYTPSILAWNEEKDSTAVITQLKLEPDEKISRAKNSEMILNACFSQLGSEVLIICKELEKYLSLEVDFNDLEATMLNVEVVRTVFQQWRKFPSPEQAAQLSNLLKHSNPAIRFRISRCILEFAKVNLFETMNLFYDQISNFIGDIDSDSARAGAVEVLLQLSGLEDKLVGATSLLAPIAFSAISDKIETIRETAAAAFRKMVTILPLEKDEQSFISSYSPSLATKYRQNLNFLNVLSAPSSLPLLTKSDIPFLKHDVDLRSYQYEGITWMMFLHKFGLNGILADDMGLGKTLQTLCLLSKVHNDKNLQNDMKEQQENWSLIVCPKTLVNHWCNEWKKYFPSEKSLRKTQEFGVAFKNFSPIVVASYEELRHQQALRTKRWKYVILDEGHCIRNHTTQLFEVVSNLISKHRLILSGTPVQNTPADLWALFRFLMPGYLSTRASFHQKYIKPMLACRNPKATEQQTREGEEALSLLHRQILPFLLRRLKTDVLNELPDKVVQDCLCQLTDIQKSMYAAIVDRCALSRDKDKEKDEFSLSALHTLISLRKLVDHPLLIAEVLQKLKLKENFDFRKKANQSYELSGKLVALKEILEECQIGKDKSSDDTDISKDGVEVPSINSHRALIFCQWRASVDLLANYFDNGDLGTGISYLRLDGTVPPADRQAVVDQFNQDESIDLMLLTTHIGGVGLNLTGADVVIFLDHDWNPTKDLQAIDRAHRLGQKKTVNVYRLITQGSIEEKIMRYQKFKSDTADVLVGADNRSIGSMATDELLALFSLEEGDTKSSNGSSTTTESDGPKTKRRKTAASASAGGIPGVAGAAAGGEKWCVEDLWDNSQYEEQHSITQFLRSTFKMAVKGNQMLPGNHFHKHWQRRIRTWFNQAARKYRRRQNRVTKAKAVAPRPAGGLLRPAVRCASNKYNTRVRLGRGFTLQELKAAGVSVVDARAFGVAVDFRRTNLSVESLQQNVRRLKEYRSRLIVFPKKAGKARKGDATEEEVKLATQLRGTILPLHPVQKREKAQPITEALQKFEVFRHLRRLRADKKYKGKRDNKAKLAAEEGIGGGRR